MDSERDSLELLSLKTSSSIGNILKNAFWLIIQPLILNLISIVVTGYIARVIGVEDFGIFNFAFLSFVPMFIALTGLGLTSVTIRDLSRDKSEIRIYTGRVLSLRIVISILAWVVSGTLIILMGHPIKTVVVVWIAGAMILAQAVIRSHDDIASSYQQMKSIALREFWSGIILTALSVIVLLFGGRLYCLSLSYIVGSIVGVILGLYYCKKLFVLPKLSWDLNFFKSIIKRGVFFYLAGVVILISDRIDVAILNQILIIKKESLEIMGYYTSAILLLSKLWIVPNALQVAVFPTLSAAWKEQNPTEAASILSKIFTLIIILTLPMALGLMLISEPIMNLIYGTSYSKGIVILSWGSILILFWSINLTLGGALGAANKEKLSFWINLLGLVLTVFLGIPLSYFMLHKGILIARIFSQLIVAIVSIILSIKVFKMRIEMKPMSLVILGNLIMGILVYFTNKLHFVLAVIVGVCSYGIFIFGLRVVTLGELKLFFRR